KYLEDIRQWLDRIDGAGEGVQLFSHQLKYVRAADLARQLSQVFGGSGGGRGQPSLMTGLQSSTLQDEGFGDRDGSAPVVGGNGEGLGEGQFSLNRDDDRGDTAVSLEIDGDPVGVSAVEETNTLLVRTSPQA